MSHHRAVLLAAGLLVIGLGHASAQAVLADAQVQADPPQAAVDAAADTQASADGRDDTQRATAGCLKETGTHIRPRDPKTGKPLCIGPGRSYTREQIDRTGQTDLADALRRLDPSIH